MFVVCLCYFKKTITFSANEICQKRNRQKISPQDVLDALEELEFGQFNGELKELLKCKKKPRLFKYVFLFLFLIDHLFLFIFIK